MNALTERYKVFEHPGNFGELSQEQFELEYSPRATVDDFMHYVGIGEEMSRKAYATMDCIRDEVYGLTSRTRLDYFPAPGRLNPIVIVVHGGFWRAMDKEQHTFMAPLFVENGVSIVVVEYDLAPATAIEEIISQVRRAIAWTYQSADKLNGDRNRIYLAGSSAGAHLCAMALNSAWRVDAGLPKGLIKGACLLSGLFDLEPLLYCEPNTWLGLTPQTARDNSPVCNLPDYDMPIVLAVSEGDTDSFKKQTRHYADCLTEIGLTPEYKIIPNRNHFDLFFDLADEKTWCARKFLEMIRFGGSGALA